MIEVDATVWGYADHRAVAAKIAKCRSRDARHETVDKAEISAHDAPEALHGFLSLDGHARGGSDDDRNGRLAMLTLRAGRGSGSGTDEGGEHEQASDGRENRELRAESRRSNDDETGNVPPSAGGNVPCSVLWNRQVEETSLYVIQRR